MYIGYWNLNKYDYITIIYVHSICILRMPQDSIPKVALRWTPTGKRNRGRPKTTWRRTITTELSDMGLTMGEAQMIAQDRHRWRRDIVALCPTLG